MSSIDLAKCGNSDHIHRVLYPTGPSGPEALLRMYWRTCEEAIRAGLSCERFGRGARELPTDAA